MNNISRICLVFLLGCSSGPAPATVMSPADYGARLAECSRVSKTCDESIACENKLRAEKGRPLRDPRGGCQ